MGVTVSIALHAALLSMFAPGEHRYAAFPTFTVEIRPQGSNEPEETALPEPPSPLASDPITPAPSTTMLTEPEPQAAAPRPHPSLPVADAPARSEAAKEKYFSVREVDVPPRPLNEVDLVYPRRAYELRMRGKLLLQLSISDAGVVDEIAVLEANPPGVFEDAAVAAASALRFSPAEKYGQRVGTRLTIEVTFDPYEKINTP